MHLQFDFQKKTSSEKKQIRRSEKKRQKTIKKTPSPSNCFFFHPCKWRKNSPICNWFLGPPWYQWTGKMASSCAPPATKERYRQRRSLLGPWARVAFQAIWSPEIFSKKTSFDKISQIKFLDLLI